MCTVFGILSLIVMGVTLFSVIVVCALWGFMVGYGSFLELEARIFTIETNHWLEYHSKHQRRIPFDSRVKFFFFKHLYGVLCVFHIGVAFFSIVYGICSFLPTSYVGFLDLSIIRYIVYASSISLVFEILFILKVASETKSPSDLNTIAGVGASITILVIILGTLIEFGIWNVFSSWDEPASSIFSALVPFFLSIFNICDSFGTLKAIHEN